MLRTILGGIGALILVAGCENSVTTPRNVERHDTHIETPNSDIKIHKEKTETPSGKTEKRIEIEKKDKQ